MTLLINVRETERAITNGELRETEREITNGELREISNIRYTRHKQSNNKKKTHNTICVGHHYSQLM